MAIKPNDEERTFGADREQSREVTTERGRSNRGFASMDSGKQREIASKGGRAAHQKGTAHEFDAGEARSAGRKGGVTVSKNREHMAAIGRRGGEARGANRVARMQSEVSTENSGAFMGDREVGMNADAPALRTRPSQPVPGHVQEEAADRLPG